MNDSATRELVEWVKKYTGVRSGIVSLTIDARVDDVTLVTIEAMPDGGVEICDTEGEGEGEAHFCRRQGPA